MPRFPVASVEDYEEPVAAAYSTQTPPHTSRHTNKTVVLVTVSSAGDEGDGCATKCNAEGSVSSPKKSLRHVDNTHADECDASMQLGKVQRAEEYPQIAFKPRHELRQRGLHEGSAAEKAAASSKRTHDFVFGRGSYGLCDQSVVRANAQEGELGHRKSAVATTAAAAGLPPILSINPKRSDTTSRGANTNASSTPQLPPLGGQSTAPRKATHATSTRLPLSTRKALPNAPRVLRCGGVIDTFSYFSVHRVHPEQYTN
jgi:hypothetical protein